ncbi:MAG: capsular polysaccharide synthesis protein [Lachnospiraceae bacterium]|nr:capsular polysaccharide synthesis protein [Lachnospiraceae bacterium]
MNLIDTLKKQGGIKIFKQYYRGGALFTAIGEFMLLGKSRTALEILRLSAALKTKQKLENRYRWKLDEFEKNYIEKEHKACKKIWICWFQGMNNAPIIVKKCYKSVVDNNPDKEVVVLTSDNINEYVTFPDYIMRKWKQGIITHTHMTDLLRLELLIKYGGLWLDATVLCTGNVPDYFFDSDLFFFQSLKPGRDGDCQYISSWLMESKTNNKILMATRELCYEYWKKNNSMWDYFLLHDFMAIVLDKYEDDWKRVIPRDNSTPHILQLRLFDTYDEKLWNAIREQTPFHKLSYKYSKELEDNENTFFERIIKYNNF